jgi:hypothetical protein
MPNPTDFLRLIGVDKGTPVYIQATVDNGLSGDFLLERFNPVGPNEVQNNKHRVVFKLAPPNVTHNNSLLHSMVLSPSGGSASMLFIQGGVVKDDPNDGPYVGGGVRLDAIIYDPVQDKWIPAGQETDKTLVVKIQAGTTKLQSYMTVSQ